jgi:hypothetical protein
MNGTLTLQAIVGKFVAGIDPKNAGPYHRGNQE